MNIKSIDARAIRVPLDESYHESEAGIDSFNHVIATVSAEGYTGVGEADFLSLAQNSAPAVASMMNRTVADELVGMDAFDIEGIVDRIVDETELVLSPESTAGAMSCVDLALWDLQGKALDLPAYKLLGGKVTDAVEVSYTLSASTPDEMADSANEMIDYGYRTLVVKAGRDGLDVDRERMRQVRNTVGDDIEIRVDVNGGYADAEEAIAAIEMFEEYDVEYVEQPIERGDVDGMRKIRESVDVPVVADESLVTLEDAYRLAESDSFDIFNIKPTKCGGLHRSCKIAAVAESAGIPCLVGGHPQQEIARQASRHFAASRSAVNCGFANEGPGPASQSLVGHVTENVVTYDDVAELDGHVGVPDDPGLGVELDSSAMDQFTVTS
ncbi:mandelate racemase/muconate lactonizing enzyme family protein [Halorussus salinisoli]|uniref:mandelate racemase/muconate lactonizing enzyme family protein n=1 Tax=Halorussus salinisoli TaxID=2558242 RepID=UPI0010C24666|nr:mandelate racemase/muconate lactonizing enzyme family protein [Halorussus salinisoli]